jgi:hypothetical protein
VSCPQSNVRVFGGLASREPALDPQIAFLSSKPSIGTDSAVAEVSGRSDIDWPYVRQRTDRFRQSDYHLSDVSGIRCIETRRSKMSIGMILLIVLVLALVGVIPTWGHSKSWGYGPSGGIGLVLLIIVILLLMGKI